MYILRHCHSWLAGQLLKQNMIVLYVWLRLSANFQTSLCICAVHILRTVDYYKKLYFLNEFSPGCVKTTKVRRFKKIMKKRELKGTATLMIAIFHMKGLNKP